MIVRCPACGAVVIPRDGRCPTCEKVLAHAASLPPVQPVRTVESPPPPPPTSRLDGRMESHLAAVALWCRIVAVLSVAGFTAFMIHEFADRKGFGRSGALFLLSIALPTVLVVAGLTYYLGLSLARRSNIARIVAGVLNWLILGAAALAALGAVFMRDHPDRGVALSRQLVSSAWCLALISVLFSRRAARVCSPEYEEVRSQHPGPGVSALASPFFWLPFLVIGLQAALLFLGRPR